MVFCFIFIVTYSVVSLKGQVLQKITFNKFIEYEKSKLKNLQKNLNDNLTVIKDMFDYLGLVVLGFQELVLFLFIIILNSKILNID